MFEIQLLFDGTFGNVRIGTVVGIGVLLWLLDSLEAELLVTLLLEFRPGLVAEPRQRRTLKVFSIIEGVLLGKLRHRAHLLHLGVD